MIRKLSFLTLALLTFGFSHGQIVQKVVIEEFTGAWCGYCPDGAIVLNNILASKPNTIGVAIHNGDGMVTANGNAIDGFLNSAGYPAGSINQSGAAISRNYWTSATTTALNGMPEAGVSFGTITYDAVFRTLSVQVNSQFGLNGTGVYRMNLFIVEDSVVGVGSGYNQSNYYSSAGGAAGGPSHPLYNSPSSIQGYQHRHVLRYSHSSWGQSGSVVNVTSGSTNSYTFTTTLPAGWDVEQLYLVGIINKYDGSAINQRKIVNAEEIKLTDALATAIAPEKLISGVTVSPNPFSDRVTLTFNLESTTELNAEVLDVNGKIVHTIASGMMNQGMHTVNWDGTTSSGDFAANGIYFIRIGTSNGKAFTSRVSFQR